MQRMHCGQAKIARISETNFLGQPLMKNVYLDIALREVWSKIENISGF